MNQQVLANLDQIITSLDDEPDATRRSPMRADNSRHVVAAARRDRKPHTAGCRGAAAHGQRRHAVTFDAVAREARVSRSWLYTQPDLRAEIERLPDRTTHPASRLSPTDNEHPTPPCDNGSKPPPTRVRQLEVDNLRLRAALAEALGTNRNATTRQPRRDTPTPARKFEGHQAMLMTCVKDTVQITKPQVKAMIIFSAQDNPRIAKRQVPAGGAYRGHFPNEQAALKVLYLVANQRRVDRDNMKGKINGWKHILNTLSTHYGDRINEAIN